MLSSVFERSHVLQLSFERSHVLQHVERFPKNLRAFLTPLRKKGKPVKTGSAQIVHPTP